MPRVSPTAASTLTCRCVTRRVSEAAHGALNLLDAHLAPLDDALESRNALHDNVLAGGQSVGPRALGQELLALHHQLCPLSVELSLKRRRHLAVEAWRPDRA